MAFLIKEYFKGDLSCNFWTSAFKNLRQSFLNFNFTSLGAWGDFKFSLGAVPSFCLLYNVWQNKHLHYSFNDILICISSLLDKNEIRGLSDWKETKNSWNKDAINLKQHNLAVTWCLTNISYILLSFGLLLTGKLSQRLINLTIFSQSVSARTATS